MDRPGCRSRWSKTRLAASRKCLDMATYVFGDGSYRRAPIREDAARRAEGTACPPAAESNGYGIAALTSEDMALCSPVVVYTTAPKYQVPDGRLLIV